MLPAFRPVRKRRAAEEVADQIRDQILARSLLAGQRLPPERELALRFGVNRTTIREALRSLEQQHLLSIHHGDGATILDSKLDGRLDLLPHLLKLDGHLDLSLLEDLLETRRALLCEAMSLIVRKARSNDLVVLAEKLESLREAARSGSQEKFEEMDWDFQEALLDAAGNQVFRLIFHSLRAARRQSPTWFTAASQDPATLVGSLQRVMKRLQERDGAGAIQEITAYLALGQLSIEADLPVALAPIPEADLGPGPVRSISTSEAGTPEISPKSAPAEKANLPPQAGRMEPAPTQHTLSARAAGRPPETTKEAGPASASAPADAPKPESQPATTAKPKTQPPGSWLENYF